MLLFPSVLRVYDIDNDSDDDYDNDGNDDDDDNNEDEEGNNDNDNKDYEDNNSIFFYNIIMGIGIHCTRSKLTEIPWCEPITLS